MLIDWFTVGAQATNFLILVWLLKRFLYRPILHAIDDREQRIARELADADATKTEAQKERDEFKHKNEEFGQQREALFGQATDDAKAERHRLLDEAKKAADVLRVKRQDAMKREQQSLNDEIIRRTREEVFAIARKTLTDLAGASLEALMCEVFTRRLRELNNEAKEGFAKALQTSSEPVLVRSAFELPSEQRADIQHALNETFSAESQVRFEIAPSVIGGIELTVHGLKVAWSIGDYLASLERSVDELMEEKSKPEAKPGIEPEARVEPKPKLGTIPAASEETA